MNQLQQSGNDCTRSRGTVYRATFKTFGADTIVFDEKKKKKTESKVPVGCFLSFQNYTITVTIRFFKLKLDRTLFPVTQESCINLWKKRYTGGGEIAGRGLRTRRKREGEERNAT